MQYKISFTTQFTTEFKHLSKRHRSLMTDFAALKTSLMANPFQGVEMSPASVRFVWQSPPKDVVRLVEHALLRLPLTIFFISNAEAQRRRGSASGENTEMHSS